MKLYAAFVLLVTAATLTVCNANEPFQNDSSGSYSSANSSVAKTGFDESQTPTVLPTETLTPLTAAPLTPTPATLSPPKATPVTTDASSGNDSQQVNNDNQLQASIADDFNTPSPTMAPSFTPEVTEPSTTAPPLARSASGTDGPQYTQQEMNSARGSEDNQESLGDEGINSEMTQLPTISPLSEKEYPQDPQHDSSSANGSETYHHDSISGSAEDNTYVPTLASAPIAPNTMSPPVTQQPSSSSSTDIPGTSQYDLTSGSGDDKKTQSHMPPTVAHMETTPATTIPSMTQHSSSSSGNDSSQTALYSSGAVDENDETKYLSSGSTAEKKIQSSTIPPTVAPWTPTPVSTAPTTAQQLGLSSGNEGDETTQHDSTSASENTSEKTVSPAVVDGKKTPLPTMPPTVPPITKPTATTPPSSSSSFGGKYAFDSNAGSRSEPGHVDDDTPSPTMPRVVRPATEAPVVTTTSAPLFTKQPDSSSSSDAIQMVLYRLDLVKGAARQGFHNTRTTDDKMVQSSTMPPTVAPRTKAPAATTAAPTENYSSSSSGDEVSQSQHVLSLSIDNADTVAGEHDLSNLATTGKIGTDKVAFGSSTGAGYVNREYC